MKMHDQWNIMLQRRSWRMFSRQGDMAALFLTSVMLVLGGCSQEGGRGAYAARDSKAQISAQQASAPNVLDYGPRQVTAGQVFNQQPNGSSAIWLKLDQSMEGTDAVISIDGISLQTSISGDVVTALVPPSLTAVLGDHRLVVSRTGPGGEKVRSDGSSLVVVK
jgi:hypothetical protein